MHKWELPLPQAPRYPDPKSKDQFTINTNLVKIISILWNRATDLDNEVRVLQKKIFELENFQKGN